MGHALVGMLIGENVFPYVRAGIGEAADARFHNALAEKGEGLGLGRGTGPQLAVAPRSVGVPRAGEFGCGIARLAGGRFHRDRQGRGVGPVVAVAVPADAVDRIAGTHPQGLRELRFHARALEVDEPIEQGAAVVEHVDVGGGPFGDAAEGGRELDLVVGGRGPSHHGILPVPSGMEGQLAGRPGDPQTLDRVLRAVAGDARVGSLGVVPGLDLGKSASVVKAARVEHDHAGIVELPQGRQKGDRVAEHGAVRRLVQQAPHNHAGVIAVAANHTQYGFVVALGHLRRIRQAPARIGFLVHHQADLIAKVQLVALGHARDEPDRVEAHRLGVDQVAAEIIGIEGHLQADWAAVARVRRAEVDAAAVQAKGALLKTEIAKAAIHRVFVR